MLSVRRQLEGKPRQVVVAGRRGAQDTRAMMASVFSSFEPHTILLLADGAENQQYLGRLLPFIRTVTMQDDKATGYLCKDYSCQLPVTEPADLLQQLAGNRSAAK